MINMVGNLGLLIDGKLQVMHCSNCGFKSGKKELNIREWTCLNCGAFHDRDVNAAINILEVVQPKAKVEIFEETVAENPVQLSLFNEVAEGHWSIIYRTRRKRGYWQASRFQ